MCFGWSLPFFLDVLGDGASCVARASEALLSAAVSVAFAAFALIFFSVLGLSAILFSGAVEPLNLLTVLYDYCHKPTITPSLRRLGAWIGLVCSPSSPAGLA